MSRRHLQKLHPTSSCLACLTRLQSPSNPGIVKKCSRRILVCNVSQEAAIAPLLSGDYGVECKLLPEASHSPTRNAMKRIEGDSYTRQTHDESLPHEQSASSRIPHTNRVSPPSPKQPRTPPPSCNPTISSTPSPALPCPLYASAQLS